MPISIESAASACAPRAAAEADDLEIDPVLLEDAGLAADLERHELERPDLRWPMRTLVCACADGAPSTPTTNAIAAGVIAATLPRSALLG
jgi:hypothetical protein